MPKRKKDKQMTVAASSEGEMTPQMYDGVIFYPTPNQMYFEYFCLTGKRVVHGEDERVPCHVSLYSIRNNDVVHFETFRAHFSDPKEYAHMLRKQTQMFGVIIRDVKKAQTFIKSIEKEGVDVMRELISGRMEEEHQQIPLWTRIKMWFGIMPKEQPEEE
jgi:hypothetical protein